MDVWEEEKEAMGRTVEIKEVEEGGHRGEDVADADLAKKRKWERKEKRWPNRDEWGGWGIGS